MLGLGSIQSSRWAFDYFKSTNSFNCNITFSGSSGSYGLWSTPTVGPDGFVYMLPCAEQATVNGAVFSVTGILVVNPGNANNGNIKYTAPQSFYLEPNSTNREAIPLVSPTNPLSGTVRFASKGILAPNGKIYFIGHAQPGVVILTPNGFNSTWEYKTFVEMGATTLTGGGLATGGVLGQDGKIYLIPNGTVTSRIDPSNDTLSLGYWNGTPTRRWSVGNVPENGLGYPKDINGNVITPPTNVPAKNGGTGSGRVFKGLKDAISHPNGKIYIFPYDPQGQSRWIFILDPANWGLINEIYSSTSLALPIPNPVTSSNGSVFGTCENIFLEKLRDGQNPDDLKIYATYSGNSAYANSWSNQYPNAKMLEFDPVDNSVGLVGSVNNAGPAGDWGQAARSGIQFPNGFISSFRTFDIANVIITGDDAGYLNKFPSVSTNVIGSASDIAPFKSFSTPPFANGSFGGSSILINESFGKIIFAGSKEATTAMIGGIAFSVKGFYPGIKYFDSGGDIYKIPNNLSQLTTSLWNSYCNKPF